MIISRIIPHSVEGTGGLVVELTATGGHTGHGEVGRTPGPSLGPGAVPAQISAAEAALAGLAASNSNRIFAALDGADGVGPAVRAAIDVAAHDLIGKARGVKVHTLLGGALRDTLELLVDIPLDPAGTLVPGGAYRVVLPDVGSATREALEVLVAAAAAAGARLDIDACGQFRTPGEVRRFMEPVVRQGVLTHLGLCHPLPHADLPGHAIVRESLPVHVVYRGVGGPADALQVVRLAAADRIVLAPSEMGGLEAARRAVDIAESAGVGVSLVAPAGVGLTAAAVCHLGMILREPYPVALAAPAAGPVSGGVRVDAGTVALTDGPGLGVTVDSAALSPVLLAV